MINSVWKWRVIIAVNFQFKQLERSLKKIKASMGFELVTSAIPVRCSANWAIYKATHWERGHFIEFISPVRSEMMWSIYEKIHIWTAVVDESEEWSSQLISRWSPKFFFRLLLSSCLNWKINCDDHSSLSVLLLVVSIGKWCDVTEVLCGRFYVI